MIPMNMMSTTLQTSSSKARYCLVIAALSVAAVLTANSAWADLMSTDVVPVGYTLNLTETSSTANLTQTYNGLATFTIINTGTDTWTLTVASGNCTFFLPQTTDWIEPENPLKVNRVTSTTQTSLSITSDAPLLTYYGGTTTLVTDGTPVAWGTDGGVPLFIRFVDQAAQNEANGNGVPDTGSTLALSAVSMIALVGLNRFRRPQLA